METMKMPDMGSHEQGRTLPEYEVMRLLRPFLESLKPGSQVLDLGAGSGFQAKEAVQRGTQVVAVDIMDRPSDLKTEQVEWVKSALEEYILKLTPDQQFDGVLLQNIIHFFPKEYVLKTLLPTVLAHTRLGASIAIETMSAPPSPVLKKFQSYYTPEELTASLQGDVLLSEQNDTQREEEDGTFRTFHHARVIVRRKPILNDSEQPTNDLSTSIG